MPSAFTYEIAMETLLEVEIDGQTPATPPEKRFPNTCLSTNRGLKLFASVILAFIWVGNYHYKYNVEAFNTYGINIWAFSLWVVWGYITLQMHSFAKTKTPYSFIQIPISWLLYFAGLLIFEYIGYYILKIRESSARPGDALIMGLVHGTYILHVYYLFFPFLILAVYHLLLAIRASAKSCLELRDEVDNRQETRE